MRRRADGEGGDAELGNAMRSRRCSVLIAIQSHPSWLHRVVDLDDSFAVAVTGFSCNFPRLRDGDHVIVCGLTSPAFLSVSP